MLEVYKNCYCTHKENNPPFSSFCRPQNCIIFLENIGTASSFGFKMKQEKQKYLHLGRGNDDAGNTTSET